MRRGILFLLLAFVALAAQAENEQNASGRSVIGVWMLESEIAPDGRETHSIYTQYTRCKIYDADSTYYTVQLHAVGNEMLIIAHEMGRFRLNDSLYMERDRVMPFEWVDDTTFITTFEGYTERKLKATNQLFLYIIIGMVVLAVGVAIYVWRLKKHKRAVERKLAEIEEERTLRPKIVADAMKQVEAEFFESEYYLSLRRQIEDGNNIKPAEWEELEQRLKVVYPHFSSSLYGLYRSASPLGSSKNLSPTEYQLCMLLKIRTAPAEIATVLNKDKSTISSMRRRLYKKVFDKDGSGKDWDEFILSL